MNEAQDLGINILIFSITFSVLLIEIFKLIRLFFENILIISVRKLKSSLRKQESKCLEMSNRITESINGLRKENKQ